MSNGSFSAQYEQQQSKVLAEESTLPSNEFIKVTSPAVPEVTIWEKGMSHTSQDGIVFSISCGNRLITKCV